jgi:hypothetical protein
MADTNNRLPEGTDAVIEAGGTGGSGGGAGRSGTTNQGGSTSSSTNATGGRTSATAGAGQTDTLVTGSTGIGTGAGTTGATGGALGGGTTGSTTSSTTGTTGTDSGSDGESGSGSSGGIRGIVGNVGTKAKDEVTNRARSFVGEGLKSGSSTLGNIANIIEDTVEQIGERLGPQYGDYAKTASQTIQRYATTLESKDPEELVDDARSLIRKSPAVAITGAAILGFGLVRLLKAGMPEETNNETRDRQGDRAGTPR